MKISPVLAGAAILAVLSSLSGCAIAQPRKDHFVDKPELRSFVSRMSQQHHFDRDRLYKLFRHARLQQSILDAIARPAEAKPWFQYRPIFVNASRIRGGVAFWNRNASILREVQRKYGVAPQIIVAILGVETRYGSHTGRYRVLDSLSTLAFDYPPRSRFFRSELAQFLLLSRQEGFDPLTLKGSYAGAMGEPQFISSSYRRYAVDFDGDGKRDLWHSQKDIIASVANYFQVHGWKPGEPVAVRAKVSGDQARQLADAGLKPKLTVAQLRRRGIRAQSSVPGDLPAALIELETRKGPEYWLGLNNFYVITRYNHSPLYAMAVFQLGEAIRSAREKAATADTAGASSG
ncbi:MAG TPA: lytic murein transglycosylase B [Gammaproteobacteria bacterium]|nr:lytic murein transglycosylase B [Gammaproteobacteria bacterium]